MKAHSVSTLALAGSLFIAGFVSAEDGNPIFDGESLAGWKALNMSYWVVEDGAITAQSTKENPCTSNQFLVWQGGDVSDFELKLKYLKQL